MAKEKLIQSSHSYQVVKIQKSKTEEIVEDILAEETPVAIVFNGISHVVMMASPCDLEDFAKGFFKKAGLQKCIKTYVGDALTIIPGINKKWDMVFVDADKENYANYYHLVFDAVKEGGLIIFDNVLWSGKVTKSIHPKDVETKTLVELANLLEEDSRVEQVLLPVRDGLFMVRKKRVQWEGDPKIRCDK